MKGNFDSIINDTRPVIVDFHALWCSPCKVQSPILSEIASEFGERVRVIKIDVDQNTGLASKYHIQGVPTVILFKTGEVMWRQSGVVSKDMLRNVILKHI
ncbi:MAG: thioredoxin [Bacteroidetes bacterium]|nr:thioredoxin [Bacteroidota bacterium]